MLIDMRIPHVNFAFNESYAFHDEAAKSAINPLHTLEELLNNKQVQIAVLHSFCGATLDGETVKLLDFGFLKTDERYYGNLIECYSTLLEPINRGGTPVYGSMIIAEDRSRFFVHGQSAYSSLVNLVYNTICVYALYRYKEKINVRN